MLTSSMLRVREPRYGHFVFLILLFAHGVPATYIPTTVQNSTNSTPEATGTQPKTDVPVATAPPSDLGRAGLGTTTPPDSGALNLTVAIGTPNSLDSHEGLKLSDEGNKKRVRPGEMLQSQFRVVCSAATEVFRMNPDPAAYPRFLETRRGENLPTLASRPNYQQQVASGTRSEAAVRQPRAPGSRAPPTGCPPGDQMPEICMSWYNCRCQAMVSEFGTRVATAPRPMDGPELIQNLVNPVPMPSAAGRTVPFQHLLDAVNMAIAADTLDELADSQDPPLYGPEDLDYRYGGPSGGKGKGKAWFFGGGYNPYGDGYNPYGNGGAGSGSGIGLKKKSEIEPLLNEIEES
ncbi:hypothetical protein TWF970_000714 [Orbilia oligospora]|uniref:Uncharacterized protein n=1 Tax=Orbilia oligospora TaxID=2813651 RepID=A0A7C8RLR1_ORBOL|nr:hypothetical protein TWF970_000714 [Orbilia oligospora]